jgi:hypothetical protein
MRVLKFLLPLWCAARFYAAACFMAGPGGLSSYRQMEAEKQYLIDNMEKIDQSNDSLRTARNSLLPGGDGVMLYARALGYGKPQEHFVRIVGLPAQHLPTWKAVDAYTPAAPNSVSDSDFAFAAQ